MTSGRNRIIYVFIIMVIILAGLSTRCFTNTLPHWVISYVGDILWAIMIFLIIGLIFIKLSSIKVALLAIIVTVSIEVSQLYHTPWIDAIRMNKIGGLILGFGFLWSDIVCYGIGIVIGLLAEKSLSVYTGKL